MSKDYMQDYKHDYKIVSHETTQEASHITLYTVYTQVSEVRHSSYYYCQHTRQEGQW